LSKCGLMLEGRGIAIDRKSKGIDQSMKWRLAVILMVVRHSVVSIGIF
jgi:hypothetical protein